MSQIKVNGNELRRLVVLPVELPQRDTPWTELNKWFREFVAPKLDVSKKWQGCWMWKGATDKRGEPRMNYRSVVREHGRVGKRKTTLIKNEMITQLKLFDAKRVPRRRLNGEELKVPDLDVRHLCGNPSCLNPNHFIVCLDDPKQHDLERLRDKYLAPGTYWNGDPV